MTVYTDVFGGGTIYPAEPTYLSLTFDADVTLQWPIEQAVAGDDIAAKIINLHPAGAGLSVSFGDARQVSTGYTATFANREADTVTIKDTGGNTVMTVASGLVWTAYLTDNSTANGTWDIFQQGAGSSTANAAALAGAGLKAITTTLNTKMEPVTQAANYVILNADRATIQEWTGGTGTFTLPDAGTVGGDWYVGIKNAGTGSVTVSPPSGTIDGSASLVLATTESTFVYSDGTNYWTMGLGQEVNSVFDFIQIDVSGTGDLTLTGAQLNRVAYRFTGILTGNRNIIVPASIQQYWVDNSTSGAFSLTVKTAAGTGQAVTQGTRNILYCDGTNVVVAVTFSGQTFADGSAASPGIVFTSNATGFYNSSGTLGISTAGTERALIDTNGAWTIDETTAGTDPTITLGKKLGSVALRIDSIGDNSTSPSIRIDSQGLAMLSFTANNGVLGTNDFRIFQQTATHSVSMINAETAAGATMTLTTMATSNNAININSGNVNCAAFAGNGVGGNAIIGISGNPDAVGFRTLTQTTIGAAGGASALPATPLGYMTVTVNGASVKIPYYNP